MKFIKDMLDKAAPEFAPEGRFSRFNALYTATRTFFLLPSESLTRAPFFRDHLELKRFMSFVILALIPVTLFGIYNTGLQAGLAQDTGQGFISNWVTGARIVLPIILVSYAVGFFWEILFATIRRHEITEGFLVTGLLFPLTLPATIPLWQVALGISFGIVIGKEVFGGTGRNLLNPALTARAFVFFSYPGSMSGNLVWIPSIKGLDTAVDAITSATPLAVSSDQGHITQLLADAGFTLSNLFIGTYPGSIGGTTALLCYAGGLFLIITRIANYRIILGGILGLSLTAILFQFWSDAPSTWMSAGPILHLISGGFALGICFMATEPVSAPGTDMGRWIYGLSIGSLTVVLRVVNPAYVEGVMLAILFMNIFAPLIDHLTLKYSISKRVPNA
ncbi:MAG: NADH:ubiquinone reductase (Na(+)-transporting) subunit B [Desulfobacteraceae bacterium]|nr:MAG: NADH:ubiquinone reductase (Na(+)-transporting) subunit B [Desulfobacteraceae bacterium]